MIFHVWENGDLYNWNQAMITCRVFSFISVNHHNWGDVQITYQQVEHHQQYWAM